MSVIVDLTAIINKLIEQSPSILTVLLTGLFQWRVGKHREKRTRADNAVTQQKVDDVKVVADETHRIGNSAHDELTRINKALGGEVERVGAGGAPTPRGAPSAGSPVTLEDNVATVEKKRAD
jgi:hypothetical protein